MKMGIDYILGAKYQKVITRNHPEGYAAGFLWKVSSIPKAHKVIRALAETGKAPIMRISFLWDDFHKFSHQDIKVARKRAREFNNIIVDHPEIKWYCQPMLEPERGKVSPKTARQIIKAVRAELPSKVKIVDALGYGDIREVHHAHASKGEIFSFDGLDCLGASKATWYPRYKNARLAFLWCAQCNGNKAGEKLPRNQRTNWLKRKHIKEMVKRYK